MKQDDNIVHVLYKCEGSKGIVIGVFDDKNKAISASKDIEKPWVQSVKLNHLLMFEDEPPKKEAKSNNNYKTGRHLSKIRTS